MCIINNFFVFWSICLSSSLVHFKNSSEYLTRSTIQVFIPLMKLLQQSFLSRSFLILLGYSFLFFPFHLLLFDGVSFQYFQILVIFFLFMYSDSLPIWQFYSLLYFSFSMFHYEHGTFFNAKFHSYILAVYSYSFFQSLRFFFFFWK